MAAPVVGARKAQTLTSPYTFVLVSFFLIHNLYFINSIVFQKAKIFCNGLMEKTTIVLDPGSYSFRAGIATSENPLLSLKTCDAFFSQNRRGVPRNWGTIRSNMESLLKELSIDASDSVITTAV